MSEVAMQIVCTHCRRTFEGPANSYCPDCGPEPWRTGCECVSCCGVDDSYRPYYGGE